jgi:predicted dehydrogenase
MSDTFVVVGLGSMGKRRVRDLKALGAGTVIGVDGREDRRTEIAEKFGVETISDFDEAMKLKPRAVMVSVPPHLHYRFCKGALDAGAAYFVECLATLSLEEIDHLIAREKAKPGFAFPSCTAAMNEYAQHSANSVARAGRVYTVHASISTWLPNQHPWEKQMGDHYEFHRSKGGGLAEPAFILSWLSLVLKQKPVRVTAHAAHLSDLPAGFNDLFDMIIEWDGGTVMNFHYAMCEKHDWSVGIFTRFSCENGNIMAEQTHSRFYDWSTKKWEEHNPTPGWKYEDIYVAEMKHFLDGLHGRAKYVNSLEVERRVLATLLAGEESSRTGRAIEVR